MSSVSGGRAVSLAATLVFVFVLDGTAPCGAAPQLPRLAERGSAGVDASTASVAPRSEVARAPRPGATTDRLNLREGPGTSFARLALLAKGLDLEVLREQEDWFFVVSGGDSGWVHRDFVQLLPRHAGGHE